MQLVIFALPALSLSFLSFLVPFKRFDKCNPSCVDMFAGRRERQRRGGLLPYPVAPEWACTVAKSDSLIEQPTILPSIRRQLTGGILVVVVVAERGAAY